ncbi:Monoterpene epsilon-lactone hydrolase [bacterium HR17]|jgi:acetyl esterase/lipase|uniref:Monoterpene epsilon-lactone hydrolase n=1 Tax=Candidatus Fervidibacter japonicus TaxID=2035412 RepID=A0A2H5X991_9BACT|nr:Monoterpene epsilon-lactone hydrolase [bacterium HR17]
MLANLWVIFFNRLGQKAIARAGRNVAVHEDLPYGHEGTEPLLLDLFVPAQASRTPCVGVVVLHGGAWCVGSRKDVAWLGYLLARRGFVAACVGYRLAPRHRYPAALHDAQAAVRWLRENADRWGVNPHRIGALGLSAGGHLALHLGLRDDERFPISSRVHRVVAIFAPTDLTAPYYVAAAENPSPLMPNYLRDFLGALYRDAPELWRDASPLWHVHPQGAPCFLIHGTRDRLVPPDQATRFADALRAVGVPVTLVLINGLGHGYSLRPTIMRQLHNALEAALQFLAEA